VKYRVEGWVGVVWDSKIFTIRMSEKGKIASFDAVNIGGAKWLSLNLKKICSKRLII
jgi:hypothetical protein